MVLLLVGLWMRQSLVVVGGILVVVTYSHLPQEPFFNVTTHFLPRTTLLFLLLLIPSHLDHSSVDRVRRARRGQARPVPISPGFPSHRLPHPSPHDPFHPRLPDGP